MRILRLEHRDVVVTYTGTRKGSPLKRGKTWTWRAPQGLSVDAFGFMFWMVCGRLVEEDVLCVKGVGFK